MKVNIITSRTGGPAKWGRELAESLLKQGIEAEHKNKLWQLILSPFYQKCDIVHSTIPLFFHLWKKPHILTIKGDFAIEKPIYRLPYRISIKRADVITVPSHFLKKRLNLKDAVVIPNALFLDNYAIKKHTHKTEIKLITIMNFQFVDKVRGISKLCNIISKVKTNKKISYTIVGDGKYLPAIKRECTKYKFEINFLGRRKDIPELLNRSDIFIYHSEHDNFPNVFLEAMATGLPVITNDVGATKEIIDDKKTGFIVKDNEYGAVLSKLINSPITRRIVGTAAFRKVEKMFTW
ncbi:MAG: glycosyltransferase family 4 protein, partial [Nanoarchaeota archaeon]|nr:glycosyltransferase family 4 protein [Nanoarchaeota archaeon]